MMDKNLSKVAATLKAARRVCFLTGAGMSVSAGIPDFRSPGGMYDTLQPELLTASLFERAMMAAEPTTVVSWDLFEDNQLPYLELRRPFILKTQEQEWKATLAHHFMELCHRHGILDRIFTQNIDGLDYQLAIPDDSIIPVHGSIGKISCEGCGEAVDGPWFLEQMRANIKDIYGIDASAPAHSSPIACPACDRNLVKPATVLYGRSLPPTFFEAIEKLDDVDALFVCGTSLTVQPAALLPDMVPASCVRVFVDLNDVSQRVGSRPSDVFLEGTTDAMLLALAQEMGWVDDLVAVKEELPTKSRALLESVLAKEEAGVDGLIREDCKTSPENLVKNETDADS